MSGNVIHTDLSEFDAHVLTDADYEEIPELTDEWFAGAVRHIGGVPVKRGRPKLKEPKQVVNLRLSKTVLAYFRQGGPGWQTRINAALEAWLKDQPVTDGVGEPETTFKRGA